MLAAGSTVLHVEDDEYDRFFMSHALKAAGLGVSLKSLSDGTSAIDYLSGNGIYADRTLYPAPALVLLDLNLPRVSGLEVLAWIRQQPHYAELPVIIVSSSHLAPDRAAAMVLGASDYFVKPNSTVQYRNIVAAIFEKWMSPISVSPSAKSGVARPA